MKEKMNVQLTFWGEEQKIYDDAKLNALLSRMSATEYIKQAIQEKNKREVSNKINKGDK